MSLAVLVKSCHRDLDRGCHEAIRSSWGRDLKALGVDTFFFMGYDPSQQDTRQCRRYISGEVVVDCKDDYESLPTKTRRMCQWLGSKMFKHVFLCDVDTLIKAKELLATDFESYDYSGKFPNGAYPGCPPYRHTDDRGNVHRECRGWASGGIGYFLSRRAAELIAATPPTHWAEDFFVGQTLAPEFDAKRMTGATREMGNGIVTSHFPKTSGTGEYKPEYMKMAYDSGSFESLFRTGKLVA
jgi:hypothetical protein